MRSQNDRVGLLPRSKNIAAERIFILKDEETFAKVGQSSRASISHTSRILFARKTKLVPARQCRRVFLTSTAVRCSFLFLELALFAEKENGTRKKEQNGDISAGTCCKTIREDRGGRPQELWYLHLRHFFRADPRKTRFFRFFRDFFRIFFFLPFIFFFFLSFVESRECWLIASSLWYTLWYKRRARWFSLTMHDSFNEVCTEEKKRIDLLERRGR